jgi:asparagine synthase (glutamine-hydrolysing)
MAGMASAIKHRGPDEEGLLVSGPAGLAHRRLKIIDLSKNAAQPMSDEASRYHIIFNGEIYNFRELKKPLQSRYPFFSQSDTEVILRLFQEHGQKTWERLNGMFAAAVLDSSTRELFIARDHAGIKPVYYYYNTKFIVFASELKGLFASGLVPAEIDPDSMAVYLRFGYCPGKRTIFRNIHKLRPGESIHVTPDGIRFHKYWDIRNFGAGAPENSPAFDDPEVELDSLLKAAVENQMISDVPLGAFLSGGIDSSLIVALMSKISLGPVKTFTVGFPSLGYYDERPHARKVADYFKTEHHEFSVQTGVDEIVTRLSNVFDEPFADSSAVPTLCLAELTRSQVTVALSGTGGDEVFGGYRKYMAAHWSHLYETLPAGIRSQIRKAAALLPSSRKTLWQERALLLQRFTSLSTNERPEIRFNTLFTDDEIQQLGFTMIQPVEFQAEDLPAAHNLMLFDFEFYLPDDLLVKEDRCTMAFGLESRVPYLDRGIIEFMSAQPLNRKVTASATKRLFRKVAARYLPPEIVHRPKHGFGSPVAEWLKTDLREMMSDLLLGPNAVIQSPQIEQKVQDHLAGKSDYSRQLWALLVMELWQRNQTKRSAL